MEALFNRNGLMFWTEEKIRLRRVVEEHLVAVVKANLRSQNKAFEVWRVEAPYLIPREFVNPNYSDEDFFRTSDDELVLRPETTAGSYIYAKHLLGMQHGFRLPMCVWQHGKSFRREQDQVTKNMRLKEFYQLEFQCVYSPDTKNDYSLTLIPSVKLAIAELIGPCHVTPSDRLPSYAAWTQDIVCTEIDMAVCSISLRTDFENARVLEVAVGTDRCVYNMIRRREQLAKTA